MTMNPATNKGASVSFNNTPQAADDFFAAAFTGLTEDALGPRVLDVMANDSGGKAKSLYSIDDGINSAGANGDLLQRDAVGSAGRSLHGATIKITADGKVSYDASTLDADFAGDLQHLGAGQFATDSFTYAIQLGNGTLSWATATVQIAGVNDAPVIISPAVNAQVAELIDTSGSASPDSATGAVKFTDADFTDSHTASVVANGSGYLGTFWLDPLAQDSGNGAIGSVGWHFATADGALDFLAAGQQLVQNYTVTIDDGHGGTARQVVSVTISGSNDGPVITSSAQTGAVNELSGTAASAQADTANGAILFTDLDLTDTHSVSVAANGTGYVGSLTLDPLTQDSTGGATGSVGWHFSAADNALDFLSQGQQLTQSYTVTVNDGHGGTALQTINVTLTGSNDAPVLQAPSASDPVLANDSLTVANAMVFTDLDLADAHTVTFLPQGPGYVGDFTPLITADANGQGSVTATYHLTKAQVEANGGVFPDHQDYLVTIDDHHGGTSSEIVSIPLQQILSHAGGGGGTTVDPPVFVNTSPPGTFTVGHDLGQIVDNPFLLDPDTVNNPPSFLPDATYVYAQGTLNFTDPDGGFDQASVDLAGAHVVRHSAVDSNGVPHPVAGPPPVSTTDGLWQVNVQGPGQIQWTYALSEADIRGMTSGESETMIVPIKVFEDGVGQSTENVRIDLFGRDEPTSMLSPDVVLTANTDITPYLLPIDTATHVQTLNYSLSEAPGVTGSTNHDTVSGTIPYVDPDLLDRPVVTMTVGDMTHSGGGPGDAAYNAAVQPLMAGFSYTVEQFGNYGMIHWTYDVPDSALDFLAQGSSQAPSAVFNVGTIAGGAFTTVNVNLLGANDAPVIQGSTSASLDVALHSGASGSFVITDPDWGPDGHSVSFVPHDPNTHGSMFGGTPVETGQGGSEPISWNYAADFGAGTLVAGQHDVWDVVVQDHSGAKATYSLDFHLV